VRFSSAGPQTIGPGPGDPRLGVAIDPVTGGGDPCASTPSTDQSDAATYRLPPAPSRGYTLLGAPRIAARLAVDGPGGGVAQVAARLWDVAPGGSQTLVARGSYRPAGSGTETWELHANGWTFARGHVPKLELLTSDPPYGRPSNLPFTIAVERLALTLPVRDRPDCRLVVKTLTKPALPSGQRYAPGVTTAVRASARVCARKARRGSRRGARRGSGPRFTG
jgi:hypothetical protein